MKTYFFSRKRLSIYSVFGFLALVSVSCGSYQNSSYYDNDGAYGNSSNNNRAVSNNNNSQKTQSDKYQEYFSDLNKDSAAFTNIDNYSSVPNNDAVNNDTQNYSQNNNTSWGRQSAKCNRKCL
ncbi:MAG: hypothetical protein QM710_12405 [Flavobacterium sp.]